MQLISANALTDHDKEMRRILDEHPVANVASDTRENERDTQFVGGEPVGPLTYGKFLECLDKARYKVFRLECASVNTHTLTFLVDSIGFKELTFGSGVYSIHGVKMKIDEQLPDHAIRICDMVYNTAKRGQ